MNAIAQSAALGLGAAVFLLLAYAIGGAIYNVYFHPLRKFPGPKLAAASKIPFCLNRCRGLQNKWAKEMHDKYGEVVRLAPDQVSFTSVEAWKDIYGHKVGGKGGMSKDLRFYGPDSAGFNGIIRANDEDHTRQRRLLAHAFSDKALREQEPMLNKYVSLLVEKLGDVARMPDGSVDMVRMLNYTTFDIMGDLAFGEPLGLLEQSDYTPWVASVFGTIKTYVLLATIMNNFPLIGAAIRRWFIPQSLVEKKKRHAAYAEERVDTRLANKTTERPDIWTFVLRHSGDKDNEGKGLALHEMQSIASTLMLAGTETTATLLSGLTYHLCLNPAKMAALKAEIRGAFSDPSQMDMTNLSHLRYMHACLEEGLRMYPPVPVGLPRVVPAGGRVVCGQAVPADTSVYLSHYAAYHSARNFCDPDEFVPERWLTPDENGVEDPRRDPKYKNDVLSVVEPFSYGPRNCIGKNLAFHEMRLILANVLWHYDIELCPESKDWVDQGVWIIWEKGPLMCKLKPAVRS
ncbi:Cytochrome p450 protein [Lasiodiplodia theobromae]|uniref:Cytochrome P450 monooxygenase rdc4 n=1 Tax=Lasiodiplodia theobromae TaxID=45133 RepID=A0A5N5DLY1_9PEZI|nr:Cytochrome p450 protein [Lasiodiplodia theobromae]KAB2578929.1 Cytochrome P450 monooxygenase rdc4 [Lasiodiplodia theobromae]KAF4545205.1 Cytochrome p450 protein [Lasiodiplodia theobromae]